MPWRPIDGEAFPTLGFHVADQMAEYLDYVVSREQLEFLIRLYEIDPLSCKRIKTRAVIQRPRGWGKSPFLAATGIGEALFEVVPDGWDADGQPVARPWIDFKTIINVPVTATSDDQVKNTWAPMLEMARTDALVNEFDAARVRDSSRRYSCLGLAFHPPFRGRARVQECGPDPRPERHLGLSRSRQAPVAYLPTSIAPVGRTAQLAHEPRTRPAIRRMMIESARGGIMDQSRYERDPNAPAARISSMSSIRRQARRGEFGAREASPLDDLYTNTTRDERLVARTRKSQRPRP